MPEDYLKIHASGKSADLMAAAIKLNESLTKANVQNRQTMAHMVMHAAALHTRLLTPWWLTRAA